jgi:hypothetical protein
MSMAPEAGDDAEKRHYDEVVASMRHYYMLVRDSLVNWASLFVTPFPQLCLRFFRTTVVKRMIKHHARLSPAQTALLPGGAAGVKAKCKAYDDALRENQRFYGMIYQVKA